MKKSFGLMIALSSAMILGTIAPSRAQNEVAHLIWEQNQLRKICKKIEDNKSALNKLKTKLSIVELNSNIVRKQMAQLTKDGGATKVFITDSGAVGFHTEAYETLKTRSGRWYDRERDIEKEISTIESRLFFLDSDKKRTMEDVAAWKEKVKKLFPKKPPPQPGTHFRPKIKKLDKDVSDEDGKVKRTKKKVDDLSDEVDDGKKLIKKIRGEANKKKKRKPLDPIGSPNPVEPDTTNINLIEPLNRAGVPRFTLFGGVNRIRLDGDLLGVTNFGANNAPIAGSDDINLTGGTFGVKFDDTELVPNRNFTSSFRVSYSFGQEVRLPRSNPAPGSNALLFPVAGGGAIGLNGPVQSRIKTDYWKIAGEAGLTYWHHRNPNSHLGVFALLGLSHAVLTSNHIIAANNLAFGNLEHAYSIRRTVFLGSLLFGLKARRSLTRWLFISGSVFAGLSYVNARLSASSCLDNSPTAGCNGLFSTASTGGRKSFLAPNFGVTAALTALFACSDRARLLGTCALATLEAGYSNSPFIRTTHQTTLGSTLGLRKSRLHNFHAMLKISIPLSFLASGR